MAGVQSSYRFALIRAVRDSGRLPTQLSPQERDMVLGDLVPPYREMMAGELSGAAGSPPIAAPPERVAAAPPNEALPGIKYKALALMESHWFSCRNAFCSVAGLRMFYPAVRRIEFGEAPDQLDRVIEVPRSDVDPMTGPVSDAYSLQYIPIRRGVTNEFVRLEFIDGTKSDVRTASIERDRAISNGVIALASNRGARDAPRLFIGYSLGARTLELTPDTPAGTTTVLYSFDDRGFVKAKRLESPSSSYYGFRITLTDTKQKAVQIKWQLSGESERGPFTYPLDQSEPLIAGVLKTSFGEDLLTAIQCFRVPELSPGMPARLASKGLSFVRSVPVVACIPTNHPAQKRSYIPSLYAEDWASVREVRLGTQPGRLDRTSTVNMTIRDVLGQSSWSFTNSETIWHGTVSADATAVYAQAVYLDGSSSPEFRVQIEPLDRGR